MSLESEVMEQISKHLTAMQVEALRKRLNKLNELETQVIDGNKVIESNKCRIDCLAQELDNIKRKVGDVQAKEKELAERETDIKAKELKHAIDAHKVEAFKHERDTVIELVKIAFAHKQTIREYGSETKQIVVPYTGGGGNIQSATDSTAKTTEIEGK